MYKIKTSDFFNDKIDTALTEAAVIEKIAEELNVQVSGDTVIKTGNAQLYFDKGYLSSIYYFPEHSGHRP